jgi:uncharacterized protein (TIGR02453 family)
MTKFEGFGPGVQEWFEGLEADNSKAYFTAHRDFFEASIRDQMEALLNELSGKFEGDVKMFRQNRDIRFSPDKSPYKTNTYGVLHGSEIAAHGLYASISARGLVAGSGYHAMARDQLDRYRDAVADDEHGPQLTKLVAKAEKAGLDLWGESLATAPRGYAKDHERIELLRRKSLSLGATLKSSGPISRADGLRFVTRTWSTTAPVTGWLDEYVGASTLPAAARGRPARARWRSSSASSVRPLTTDSGRSATTSEPGAAYSSRRLTNSHCGLAPSPVRWRANPPWSFSPRSTNTAWPRSSASGHDTRPPCSYTPRSQMITPPWPVRPSNSLWASSWSSTCTANRFAAGSMLGPRGTAHDRITPSTSSRTSKWCAVA